MRHHNVQKLRITSQTIWAFGILCTTSGFFSCKKAEPPMQALDYGECRISDTSSPSSFKKTALQCSNTKINSAPILYSHFIDQSLTEEICFEDVLNNKSGAIQCAPGPFLIENGAVTDTSENEWAFSTTPDYFVWHLENDNAEASSRDESFYLTTQNGFPIKSQAIRFQDGLTTTIVLLPKAPLIPGTKYYIYMVENAKTAKKSFIQPLMVAKN